MENQHRNGQNRKGSPSLMLGDMGRQEHLCAAPGGRCGGLREAEPARGSGSTAGQPPKKSSHTPQEPCTQLPIKVLPAAMQKRRSKCFSLGRWPVKGGGTHCRRYHSAEQQQAGRPRTNSTRVRARTDSATWEDGEAGSPESNTLRVG